MSAMSQPLIVLVSAIVYLAVFVAVALILFWILDKAQFREPAATYSRWAVCVLLIVIVLLWLAGVIQTPVLFKA